MGWKGQQCSQGEYYSCPPSRQLRKCGTIRLFHTSQRPEHRAQQPPKGWEMEGCWWRYLPCRVHRFTRVGIVPCSIRVADVHFKAALASSRVALL